VEAILAKILAAQLSYAAAYGRIFFSYCDIFMQYWYDFCVSQDQV